MFYCRTSELTAKCSHSFLFLSWTKPALVKTGRKRICLSTWVITENPQQCQPAFLTGKKLKVATKKMWKYKTTVFVVVIKFLTYIMTSILQWESSNVKRNGRLLKLWLLICFIGFPEIIMNWILYFITSAIQ